jgi:aminoglycoside 6'-N-acetyltransferase I
MRIVDLDFPNEEIVRQAAALLVDGFRENWPGSWPTLGDALEEVREADQPGRIARAALDDAGNLLGWVGGIERYHGRVWELHPLVVARDVRGQGVGRALVSDLEQQVVARGALTLMLGTDDESSQTTLSDVDLYADLPTRLASVRNLKQHPYEFYQRLGYTIVGVVPDANGIGKPDILMAKRIGA